LGQLHLDELVWPLNKPSNALQIRDLGKNDHVVIFPYSKTLLTANAQVTCKVSLILVEPKAVHARYYNIIPILRYLYHNILVRDPKLASKFNNVHSFSFAELWIETDNLKLPDFSQKGGISLIASMKNDLEGHKLRHKLISFDKSHTHQFLTPLGRAYEQFENMVSALAPFQYSVVIENSIEPHYFSEKILNCLACKTIPIYWGHESIKQYFDTSNWLFFNDLEDGYEKIKFASSGEHIVSHTKIHENYLQAKSYKNLYKRMSKKITE
tara:strand:- start:302 stop:1105 length:804 start_codon:yes stop_codon:yes gene_type:complete